MNKIIEEKRKSDSELGLKLIEALRETSKISMYEDNTKTREEIELNDFCEKKVLDISDIQEIFGVGVNKARKIMQVVPHFRVGNKDMCTCIKLYEAAVNNKLKIKW